MATRPGAKGRISTVAWIEGQPAISNQPAERLSISKVRRLSGHSADGSTLPRDRGIRRAPMSLTGLPGFVGEAIDDTVRSVADARSGSGRMLVLVGVEGPPRRGVAICDKNEIPLDYDRRDPIPWPEATENWC